MPFTGDPLPPGEHAEGHITIDGQRLRVALRGGRPGRVPLLFINGLAASLDMLQPTVDALDPDIPAIRFDVPGIGGSPAPDQPYRFTGLSKMIAKLLARLGHERADVLGVSWGGGVAQQFAWCQRPRCRRLVLVSTGTGITMVPASPLVLTMLVLPPRLPDIGYAERIAPSLYGGSARTNPAAVVTAMRAAGRLGSHRGAQYQIAAGFGWTSLPFLPLLPQPTLVMSGSDDPIIPLANAYMLNTVIPRSRLHVFDGGHLGLITEAAELVPLVSSFLAESDEAAASREHRRNGRARRAAAAPLKSA
jgi:poly(3-hydroxyalkanoate) depolymerase